MRSIAEIFRSYAILNAHGVHVNGTDKESNHHYGDAYDRILTIPDATSDLSDTVKLRYPYSIRNDIKLVMEIGVADGACLRAWREVFPNALIVGMDIHHSDGAHGDRIEFRIGDATSKEDCDRTAAGRLFDLIIDDATHHQKDLLRTLLYMWPYVKPGGLYVIEEFEHVTSLRSNIKELWSNVEIIGTCGPYVQDEPLVVLRKPVR